MWAGGGLGQADPTQPVDTSVSGALPTDLTAYTGTGTGLTISPGLTIPNPFASWGSGEWIVAVLGAFAVYALLHTAGEGVSGVSTWRKKRKARAARKRELESEYAGL